jgi:hypothetical protein
MGIWAIGKASEKNEIVQFCEGLRVSPGEVAGPRSHPAVAERPRSSAQMHIRDDMVVISHQP